MLHELTTNALKQGAWTGADGLVEVAWTIDRSRKPGMLHLSWQEKGGPPVQPPKQKGFGSVLLETGIFGDGTVVPRVLYEETGFRYEITIPLN